ncbi:MAG: M48 family metallopeptidase [Candidatus Obscuribacterales bacterium]|nr:M48 family metallopeptidase [Steroidobacteraceae bacterium]
MREEITALVFGPGLPAGGAPGTLSVTASGIVVSAQLQNQSARFSELALREVGFGESGLEFAWSDAGEQWAVHVLDAATARRLLAMPACAAMSQADLLKGKQQRNKMRRVVGRALIALFVLLPVVMLVVLFFSANRIARWAADKIPIEQEIKWGRQAFSSVHGTLKLVESGPAYSAVQAIGAKLTQGSRYRYEFYVVDDKSVNAYAMPGGFIVIHSGLIAATKRPEELAGVLAHEVQHVEQRHAIKGMIKELGLRGLWRAITGDLGATLAGEAALQITSLKFSRDDERAADHVGFDALVQLGIDPAGMPAFFKTLSEQAAGAPAAFLSTHPLSVDRQQDLQARVESVREVKFLALSFGSWPPALNGN